ncbi:hypothetical protein BBK36DRAFT_1144111 [Trichoderma citrinoviride]|uniref:Uncharacterized protein n=1 Tax=Trichoderma citrinoviride TaxID=58853 RepID=A0A2T4B142_9HYPO|nr:hypothetical protein BBK36DRAFT_1144111 [Trichoderma citrinoviride]PTB63047.1 hypothetical protein BBK36DRAFT_1144111 [Trichoderma citrinoviride]
MAVIAVKLVVLLASAAAVHAGRDPILPFHESAKANANHIFNAIHSAGRQWGSSLNHNGFGFIPVVVPAGTSFYHGGYFQEPPKGTEWLAFEVEHAEFFARPQPRGPGRHRPCPEEEQPHPLADQPETESSGCDEKGQVRGYLQTYHTTRDIQLLYLDGMSAGKTYVGTLDSQDQVLCQNNSTHWDVLEDDMSRARALCDVVTEWGWDGIMRMEAGFEVIYCNFSSGLHLDSSLRTPLAADRLKGEANLVPYLWLRAAGERYDGIGGERVKMDFSSMVSGFFFPINISSTDPERPDLIRLGAAKQEHLQDIKAYLQNVFVEPRKFVVNWQAVVDMIVARFEKRLAAMASTDVSADFFIGELEGVALTYYEAPRLPDDITLAAGDDDRNRTAEAIDRCAAHYLIPALPRQQDWTLSDALIHTALEVVMKRICSDLFLMRAILLQAVPDATPDAYLIKRGVESASMEQALNQSRAIARNLVQELAWTTWLKPQVCSEEEVLFVAMWPMGDDVDHYNPGCVPYGEISGKRRSYWKPGEQKPRIQ